MSSPHHHRSQQSILRKIEVTFLLSYWNSRNSICQSRPVDHLYAYVWQWYSDGNSRSIIIYASYSAQHSLLPKLEGRWRQSSQSRRSTELWNQLFTRHLAIQIGKVTRRRIFQGCEWRNIVSSFYSSKFGAVNLQGFIMPSIHHLVKSTQVWRLLERAHSYLLIRSVRPSTLAGTSRYLN